ncbi:putative lipoprotein [Hyphomonas neptunium ATCC 15444]|uniref:Putative lipoprotein n=2 Tax=Hyphomonas TaxID=85 RepID=Q0C620_HYPNA|nr:MULTISPECIES: spore coat U domain-containing protein [Hyphomonas]ABI76178.1 putative lipoprotein [Hyphomonas neptunium ATCC 15444]KCZ94902.1 putative lipoprotein [Hyphomonas hirschiana VP5]
MWRLIVLVLSLFVLVCPALAQSCTVSSTPLSFTPYHAFSGNASTGSATVTVSCSGLLFVGASYEVRLGGGQSGNIMARKMKQASSGQELSYQVYTQSAQVWGNGVQGSTINDFFLLGLLARSRAHPITGTIPANQQVNSGSYSDAVTMTVIW